MMKCIKIWQITEKIRKIRLIFFRHLWRIDDNRLSKKIFIYLWKKKLTSSRIREIIKDLEIHIIKAEAIREQVRSGEKKEKRDVVKRWKNIGRKENNKWEEIEIGTWFLVGQNGGKIILHLYQNSCIIFPRNFIIQYFLLYSVLHGVLYDVKQKWRNKQ